MKVVRRDLKAEQHPPRGLLAAAVLLVCVIGPGRLAHSEPVVTRELLLVNKLDVPRIDELVAVSLRGLNVSAEQESQIADVEVVDPAGRPVVCQYDPFGQVRGFTGEVSLLADLEPYERRRLTVRFLARAREPDQSGPRLRSSIEENRVRITAPEFSALMVKQDDGLWFRRVILGKSEDEAEGEMFGEPVEEEGTADGTTAALGPVGDEQPSMPFADGGLPLAFQGLRPFSKNTSMKVWGGPVRVAVTLYDRVPWGRTACTARQTLSIPARGRVCYLKCVLRPEEKMPRGGLAFGGLRVATPAHTWDMRLGQKDEYVGRASPVKITLIGKKGSIFIYPPYLHSTFNHITGRVSCDAAWAGVAVDRSTGNLAKYVDRVSGKRQLVSRLRFEDAGVYGNSLQLTAGFRSLPAGFTGVVRAGLWFGGKEEPGDMVLLGRKMNSLLFVPHVPAKPADGSLDAARVAKLIAERPVIVVRPDVLGREGDAFWQEVAKQLGGTVISTASFRRYVHWVGGGPPILAVLAGEPGEHDLLDQFHGETPSFNRYPLSGERYDIRLAKGEGKLWERVQGDGAEGEMLVVSGNSRAATAQALDRLRAAVKEGVPTMPPVGITARAWTSRVPLPWLGLRGRDRVSSCVAYRNGYAEHLFLVCANREVRGLKAALPEGMQAWHARWRCFDHIIPASDAALPGLPEKLEQGDRIALWLSMKIPPNAPPEIREDEVTLDFDGHRHQLALRTEVLPPVLPGNYALGFRPMYAGKHKFRFYLGCKDDEDYYRKLPRALRQAGEFGVNYYTLDLGAMKVVQGNDGGLRIDASEFKRELDAVREAGTVDVMLVSSTHRVLGLGTIGMKDPLAWLQQQDRRIALLRKTLRELGVQDQLYCCYNDEIQDYEIWLYHARRLKRSGFKLNVCVNGYGVWNKHLAVGTMDMWTPQYPIYMTGRGTGPFNKEFRDARLAEGNIVWPYVCGAGPYASSSRPRSQARYLIIDLYQKGAQGLTYYGGFGWPMSGGHRCPGFVPGKPYDLIRSGRTFEVLFYPQPETASILPSLRSVSFRLGLEDATAADVVLRLARDRGGEGEAESAIAKAHSALHKDSPQEAFDAFRRTLGELYQGLVAK